VKIEQKQDINPICPHCQQQLDLMWSRELEGLLGKRYVYFCPHCRKVLGVTHRKGFWMG
jgi:glutaredoxin